MMNQSKNILARIIVFVKTGKWIVVTPHRLKMLQRAMQYARNEKVPGDYFEFGVARGLTFAAAYTLVQKYDSPIKHFYAFDSFEGFPELHEVDSEFKRFETGDESWSTKQFEETLQKADVPEKDVTIVPGWFKDSLNQERTNTLKNNQTKVSIAWIDCDLYESTKEVLDFIAPFLQNGTVLVFDDWFCYHANPEKGEMRAVREFLQENPHISVTEYRKFGIVGNSFIVNVKK